MSWVYRVPPVSFWFNFARSFALTTNKPVRGFISKATAILRISKFVCSPIAALQRVFVWFTCGLDRFLGHYENSEVLTNRIANELVPYASMHLWFFLDFLVKAHFRDNQWSTHHFLFKFLVFIVLFVFLALGFDNFSLNTLILLPEKALKSPAAKHAKDATKANLGK